MWSVVTDGRNPETHNGNGNGELRSFHTGSIQHSFSEHLVLNFFFLKQSFKKLVYSASVIALSTNEESFLPNSVFGSMESLIISLINYIIIFSSADMFPIVCFCFFVERVQVM